MQKQNEAVLVSMLSSGTPATISEQLCKPMFAKLGQACVLHGCMCPMQIKRGGRHMLCTACSAGRQISTGLVTNWVCN
jgi:hypothetical protein